MQKDCFSNELNFWRGLLQMVHVKHFLMMCYFPGYGYVIKLQLIIQNLSSWDMLIWWRNVPHLEDSWNLNLKISPALLSVLMNRLPTNPFKVDIDMNFSTITSFKGHRVVESVWSSSLTLITRFLKVITNKKLHSVQIIMATSSVSIKCSPYWANLPCVS